jgi:hypothetical protein
VLTATVRGWICCFCDYVQDWAHDFMAAPDGDRVLEERAPGVLSFCSHAFPVDPKFGDRCQCGEETWDATRGPQKSVVPSASVEERAPGDWERKAVGLAGAYALLLKAAHWWLISGDTKELLEYFRDNHSDERTKAIAIARLEGSTTPAGRADDVTKGCRECGGECQGHDDDTGKEKGE